jgi:hypothetical protein
MKFVLKRTFQGFAISFLPLITILCVLIYAPVASIIIFGVLLMLGFSFAFGIEYFGHEDCNDE